MSLKHLVFFILFVFSFASKGFAEETSGAPAVPPSFQSQNPAVRPRPPDDPNKESSSFMGDAENLDPLRARSENLKEDNEPVLEDIKQVLDAPPPPTPVGETKSEPKSQTKIEKPARTKRVVVKKKLTATKKTKPKVAAKTAPRAAKKVKVYSAVQNRNADDPDEAIEKKFYRDYQLYNSQPTSVEAWSKASFGRSSEIYVVQKGDTLWTISETLFGDSLFWPKIWALNRQGIVNPHYILPGMRVIFYPGNAEDLPTLSLDQKEPSLNNQNENADDEYATPAKADQKKLTGAGSEATKENSHTFDRPTRLPPSLPVYRSGLYYGKLRKIDIINLEEQQFPPIVYENDIILADRLVLTDIKISTEGNKQLRCFPGELLQDYEFVRKTQTDEYTILQPLDRVVTDKDKTTLFPYKKVGKISLYGADKLKIKQCNSYLNSEQVFVPTSVIDSLKTRKSSDQSARIIGGPVLNDQINFKPTQYVYLNMGSLSYGVDQTFGIRSYRTDSIVGKIKILDQFGSYAVGVLTRVDDSIRVGDEVEMDDSANPEAAAAAQESDFNLE